MANSVSAVPLLAVPAVGLWPIDTDEANVLLVEWGHNLGPCERPFRSGGWLLEAHGKPVAVAVSASIVSAHVTDEQGRVWKRTEVVELARLGRAPDAPWALRPMLRLWRECAVPVYMPRWKIGAAVSYSQDRRHEGEVYRFDGWKIWQRKCRSSGGGTWSTKRAASDEVTGDKTLWGWRY